VEGSVEGVPNRLESRLVEDLMIDSPDLVSMVVQFQDHFDVVIEEDAVPNLRRVGDIVDYLARLRASPEGIGQSQAESDAGVRLKPDVLVRKGGSRSWSAQSREGGDAGVRLKPDVSVRKGGSRSWSAQSQEGGVRLKPDLRVARFPLRARVRARRSAKAGRTGSRRTGENAGSVACLEIRRWNDEA
jgi:acyl carrier protein